MCPVHKAGMSLNAFYMLIGPIALKKTEYLPPPPLPLHTHSYLFQKLNTNNLILSKYISLSYCPCCKHSPQDNTHKNIAALLRESWGKGIAGFPVGIVMHGLEDCCREEDPHLGQGITHAVLVHTLHTVRYRTLGSSTVAISFIQLGVKNQHTLFYNILTNPFTVTPASISVLLAPKAFTLRYRCIYS